MAQLTSGRDRRSLTWFNTADPIAARYAVLRCCSAAPWADALITGRPYRSLDDLLKTSDDAVIGLAEHDIEQAIAGHPRIGENSGQRWSRQEQSGTHDATERAVVREELRKINRSRLEKLMGS